ncbi:MAG: AAA family ATPase [Rhodospirillales bacterium]|nr:AAA family ATPase [Rhodospirillales bacterium]
MGIVKLNIKNFLAISDVEIRPGKVNQVHGKNNQGKTTVLKALEFAYKGSTDGSLVRLGSDHAEVIVELDDMVIRRRLSPSGDQKVEVVREGFKSEKPQTFSEYPFDGLSFNPLEILDPKLRTQFILKALNLRITREQLSGATGIPATELPPLDFERENALVVIDQAHKYFYQRRAEANRVAGEKKVRWETYAKDLPPERPAPRGRDEIQAELDQLKSKRDESKRYWEKVEAEERASQMAVSKVSRYEAELAKIQKELDDLRAEYEKRTASDGAPPKWPVRTDRRERRGSARSIQRTD